LLLTLAVQAAEELLAVTYFIVSQKRKTENANISAATAASTRVAFCQKRNETFNISSGFQVRLMLLLLLNIVCP